MSYCVKFRQLVLDFCERSGNSIRKASQSFGLSTFTIQKWKRWKKEGNLAGQIIRQQKKLDLESLKELLNKSPDLLQREMAEHFMVNVKTIRNGLKKIGYKRKKKRLYTKKGASQKGRYIWTK
jgi:transposase